MNGVFMKHRRGWVIAAAIVGLLILAVIIAASVMEEPLRQYAEVRANVLSGYHLTIGRLDLHPLSLSIDLRDVILRQDVHPAPPVLSIPHVSADARLVPLFSGKVAADLRLEDPVLSLTRRQIERALRRGDEEELKEESLAWQDRLREMMGFQAAFSMRN